MDAMIVLQCALGTNSRTKRQRRRAFWAVRNLPHRHCTIFWRYMIRVSGRSFLDHRSSALAGIEWYAMLQLPPVTAVTLPMLFRWRAWQRMRMKLFAMQQYGL